MSEATMDGAVRGVAERLREAIVGKDAAALGALMTDDCEFVNIAAMRWSGREAVASSHAKMFAGPLQISLEYTRVDVRALRDDVALVNASWKRDTLPNATGPTLPPGTGEFTFVLTRDAAGWRIASAHNTQTMAIPGAPPPKP
jgi:uncharacterized protein (TIGR02246 family)